MNNKKSSLGSIAALFLVLFLSLIILYMLFAVFGVNDYEVFPVVLLFLVINLLVILAITVGGSALANRIGTASYTSLCVVTAIYSLFQFIHLGFSYDSTSVALYTLYHLVILFIYFLIVIPISIMGMKNKNEN